MLLSPYVYWVDDILFHLMFACQGARYKTANMEWLWSEYQ